MAGNHMRQIAYDECQREDLTRISQGLVFVLIGVAKNVPEAKQKDGDCNADQPGEKDEERFKVEPVFSKRPK